MKKSGLKFAILFLSFLAGLLISRPAHCQSDKEMVLWKTGEGNYKGYRIPSLLLTKKGTLLAFAEGRNAGGDSGDIDIVLKRSTDNGNTWKDEQIVWNDSLNTCGNPCPVQDAQTGRIWLVLTWNHGKDHEKEIIRKTSLHSRIPYSCFSDDEGVSWSKPVPLSATCKDPSWGWYATGPGIGIQLKGRRFEGRLVIPANHSYDDPEGKILREPFGYGAHVLLSDDHGQTWRKSTSITPGCNESQVTELEDGTLLMNMRSYNGKGCRAISFSTDGGESWAAIDHDEQLIESICQASIFNFGTYKGNHIYLFSNPAVQSGRTHMTLKFSLDQCRTWSDGKLLFPGPSGYSCIAGLKGKEIGILFEKGEKNPYETISFARIHASGLFRTGYRKIRLP